MRYEHEGRRKERNEQRREAREEQGQLGDKGVSDGVGKEGEVRR